MTRPLMALALSLQFDKRVFKNSNKGMLSTKGMLQFAKTQLNLPRCGLSNRRNDHFASEKVFNALSWKDLMTTFKRKSQNY